MDEHEHATGSEGTPGYRLERPGGMGGSDAVRVGVGWRGGNGTLLNVLFSSPLRSPPGGPRTGSRRLPGLTSPGLPVGAGRG